MFANKELRIFDTKTIKNGQIITYCFISKDWEWDEKDGEEVPVYYENPYENGIVIRVEEEELAVVNKECGIDTIHIGEVIQESDEERTGIKILGIRENAI